MGLTIGEVVSTQPRTVGSDELVEDAARMMWGEGFQRVPVVDEGRLGGILTSLDFVRLVGAFGLVDR